jgi:hypothetical protein
MQPVHAVYYRNTELAARIRVFVDYLGREWRGSQGAGAL